MKVSNLYFAVILIFLIYLMWVMMQPFLNVIIFASIIAGGVYPWFGKLLEKTRLSRPLGASVMCGLIILVIFVPMIWLLMQLSREAVNLYQHLTALVNNESVNQFLFGAGYFAESLRSVGKLFEIDVSLQAFRAAVVPYIKGFSVFALGAINGIVGDILTFLFNFSIMILVVYAFLAEGSELKTYLFRLSPLPDDQEELILQKFNQMNFVTLVCNGIGGLIQGVLAGLGFWIAGVELVVLWTTVMAILGFIPLLGISVVYFPVCIYLWLTGQTFASVVLFIYCSLVAFLTENWFKPIFIGNRIQINSLLVLFTIIGGMTVFGIGGVFYGPLIAILFLTTVDLYHTYYAVESN